MTFDPQGLATAIGSMSHTTPSDACDIILNAIPEIPFWPQLPNTNFREEMAPVLEKIGKKEGTEYFVDKIADETVAITEEEVLEFISKKNHPVLAMPPLF
ncbi:MAG: hypothetical protein JSV17_18000 [Candidatus Aminicenantes bacterium]|nr:MAG: hypothetical protein JSV17_18000 [Candidatus Aminicenantes bacterium]